MTAWGMVVNGRVAVVPTSIRIDSQSNRAVAKSALYANQKIEEREEK